MTYPVLAAGSLEKAPMPRFRLLPLLAAAALALAACDTAEERAEGHYQRALSLLAEGEPEKAVVEFRNVFRLDGNHDAARLAFADLLVERGDIEQAIGQYLRLVEQDWSNVDGHKRLTELALSVQDFDTAETHAARAYDLDPDDPEIRGFRASLDYRAGKRAAAVKMARGVLEDAPDNLPAQMVLIAERMNAGDDAGALDRIDAALRDAPRDEALHLARLTVLERRGATAEVGDQLTRMAGLFPDNDSITLSLVQWHLRAGDPAEAEALLRARAAARPAGTPERVSADLALVQALAQTQGAAAAQAELEAMAAAADDPVPYRRAHAGIDIAAGELEAGIATLREVIAAAEPSDTRRETQVTLARILTETGDAEAADALIDAVLEEDAFHVAALKLRAQRRIDADRPDAAVRDLRSVLNQAPRDTDALTLMAVAHERQGARELAGERLALAVEASGQAPAESIRYARFLMQDGRYGPAESVLREALRRRPGDVDLLTALAGLHIEQRDWTRARSLAATLRDQGTPEAAARATALEAQVLSGQDRFEETIALLRELAQEGGGPAALAGIVQTYVRAGDLDGARSYLEGERATDPAAPLPRLMLAGVEALAGNAAEAEAAYRALIADRPEYGRVYEGLYLLLATAGRGDEAAQVLEDGLAATGGDPRLLFIKAGLLEARGDVEGAIEIYDRLYARDSASALVANNLASLLASHRDDAASQERAYAIARRLRSTDVPHFQDTYGWILARRGDYEAALPHLERAAAALPGNASVLYHLGAAQHGLGRLEAAQDSLERALAAAGPETPADERAAAQALLAQIAAVPEPAD